MELFGSRKFEQARNVFKNVLQVEPSCTAAYDGLGLISLEENDFRKAEGLFRKAISLSSPNADYFKHLGSATYSQGHYHESIASYKKALALSGQSDPQVEVYLADALREQGDSEGALKHYVQAIKIKPDYANAYNSLAVFHYNHGRLDQALENARTAVKLQPNYALAYYHLGLIEAARRNVDGAKEALERSLKYETNPDYITDTTRILQRLNKLSTASRFGQDEDNLSAAISASSTKAPLTGTDPGTAVTGLLKHKRWKQAQKALEDMIRKWWKK